VANVPSGLSLTPPQEEPRSYVLENHHAWQNCCYWDQSHMGNRRLKEPRLLVNIHWSVITQFFLHGITCQCGPWFHDFLILESCLLMFGRTLWWGIGFS
jgi:hypothetical protein